MSAAGVEDLGLAGGEDNKELVNERLATINLFLRFLFRVLGESLVLKTRSSAELSSLASMSWLDSSSAGSVTGSEAATELLETSNTDSVHVRVL